MQGITTAGKVFNGIICTFLAILMIRITFPIVNWIFSNWESNINRAAGWLVYWLIIIFVLYFLTWMIMFQEDKQEQQQVNNNG